MIEDFCSICGAPKIGIIGRIECIVCKCFDDYGKGFLFVGKLRRCAKCKQPKDSTIHHTDSTNLEIQISSHTYVPEITSEERVHLAFDLIRRANSVSILTLDEMKALVLRAIEGEFDLRVLQATEDSGYSHE